MLTKAVLSE